MSINWRIATLILLNLTLLLSLAAAGRHEKIRIRRTHSTGPLTLIAANRGISPPKTIRLLLEPSRRSGSAEISPEIGTYILGTNLLGRLFPRYIYFRDGSSRGTKIVLTIQENGTLTMSLLKGCIKYKGLVYHKDKSLAITINKGESFWLGQSEIKVR